MTTITTGSASLGKRICWGSLVESSLVNAARCQTPQSLERPRQWREVAISGFVSCDVGNVARAAVATVAELEGMTNPRSSRPQLVSSPTIRGVSYCYHGGA